MEVMEPEPTSQLCNTKQSWNTLQQRLLLLLKGCSSPGSQVWCTPNQPETELWELDTLSFEGWLCLS